MLELFSALLGGLILGGAKLSDKGGQIAYENKYAPMRAWKARVTSNGLERKLIWYVDDPDFNEPILKELDEILEELPLSKGHRLSKEEKVRLVLANHGKISSDEQYPYITQSMCANPREFERRKELMMWCERRLHENGVKATLLCTNGMAADSELGRYCTPEYCRARDRLDYFAWREGSPYYWGDGGGAV